MNPRKSSASTCSDCVCKLKKCLIAAVARFITRTDNDDDNYDADNNINNQHRTNNFVSNKVTRNNEEIQSKVDNIAVDISEEDEDDDDSREEVEHDHKKNNHDEQQSEKKEQRHDSTNCNNESSTTESFFPSEELVNEVNQVLEAIRLNKENTCPILEKQLFNRGPECRSFLDDVSTELQGRVLALSRRKTTQNNNNLSYESALISRSVGSMVGMAIADGLGHNFEFMPVCDHVGGPTGDGPRLELKPGTSSTLGGGGDGGRGVLHKPLNVFELKPGQWTDDASMGLCVADSLLARDDFDGSHCRVLFFNWWENGFNNAFKFDDTRNKNSVGLGSNIQQSLIALKPIRDQMSQPTTPRKLETIKSETNTIRNKSYKQIIPPRYEPADNKNKQDAGNGSLMRLCAIPIFYSHFSTAHVRRIAYESSLMTHPGPMAAEACAFLACLIVKCIRRKSSESNDANNKDTSSTSAKEFLDKFVSDYQILLLQEIKDESDSNKKHAKEELLRLLESKESEESNERCWNWRYDNREESSGGHDTLLLGVEQTLINRGHTYNGYPVSREYFGSFSLDALAMALFCVRTTTSFNDAVVRCICFLGDADTTGAITAQIAGAFYGCEEIQSQWKDDLEKWDGQGGFELRAVCLAIRGWEKARTSVLTYI